MPEVGVRHERTCADVDALVRDVVSDTRARGADAPDVPEDLARRCACAAAAFVCRQLEEVSRGLARDPASRVNAARDAQRLCTPPCEIDLDVTQGVCDAPDLRAETEGACLGPVCHELCAPCVTEAAAAAAHDHDHDIPFDRVRAACGDERACLCAQCLDAALLERIPTDDAGRWGGGGSYYGYFAIRPHTSEVHTRTSGVRTATAPARVRDTARRIAQSVAAVVTRIPTPTPALTPTGVLSRLRVQSAVARRGVRQGEGLDRVFSVLLASVLPRVSSSAAPADRPAVGRAASSRGVSPAPAHPRRAAVPERREYVRRSFPGRPDVLGDPLHGRGDV